MVGLKTLIDPNWLGIIIGALSLIFAYVFYLRSRQFSQLYYLLGEAELISPVGLPFSQGLEVRYRGNVVPRVTTMSLGIWNAGTTTIRGSDIVEADMLKIQFPADAKILQSSVEAETRTVNKAEIKQVADNKLFIEFDFLDPGDAFRIQLVHSEIPGSAQLTGTIRGLPLGAQRFPLRHGEEIIFALTILISGIGLIFVISTILAIIIFSLISNEFIASSLTIFMFIGTFFLVHMLFTDKVDSWLPKNFPRLRGVPKVIVEDSLLHRS